MNNRMSTAPSNLFVIPAFQAGEFVFDNSNFKSYERIPSVSNYNRNPFPFGNGIFSKILQNWDNKDICQ